MGEHLIDDGGCVVQPPYARLAEQVGAPRADFNLPEYFVRNMGFVWVRAVRGGIRVAIRPAIVGPLALATLCYDLADRASERVLVSYLTDRWMHEIVHPSIGLFTRLTQLVEQAKSGDRSAEPLAAPRHLDMFESARRHPLGRMLALWRDTGGIIRPGVMDAMQSTGTFERTMVGCWDGALAGFVFVRSGAQFRMYDPDWHRQCAGRPIADQPDRAYGRWVARTLRDVSVAGAPRFEFVHAVIGDSRSGRPPWRYERIVLPWRNERGERIVTTTSLASAM